MNSLARVVSERPFPEFAQWWKMGDEFISFMSAGIVSQWRDLDQTGGDIARVQSHLAEYLHLVYGQEYDPALLDDFVQKNLSRPFYSGEFDALSYAFYRSAFEVLAEKYSGDDEAIAKERRRFTIRVGKIFFTSIHDHLLLDLPSHLKTSTDFVQLQTSVDLLGKFLLEQAYLRDQCTFTFSLDVTHAGDRIKQEPGDFLHHLHRNGVAYALYIMGYPAILPSAVYLFKLFGEAQHHSSRTIEELFNRVGYQAHETDNFDPSAFPPDRVVELWSIRSK